MTKSSTKELFTPYEEPERVLHSTRKLFKTTSLDYSSSPEFDLFSDLEDQCEEEVTEAIGEPTMEEYMTKTREDYGSGIARQIFDSKGVIPSMKVVDAKKAIQDMADHSKKWHNGMSTRTRSTDTFDGLAAIQAQLNNLGREIKKEDGKTLEEAYYTQFRVPFPQGGRYRAVAPGFYQRDNGNPSYQERRQRMEESLSKFMVESAKRHDEKSNLIKEIRASTDAAIRNQRVLIKALEIQIGQMSKVLQEKGPESLPGSTETNLRDHVKLISTTVEANMPLIPPIEPSRYAVLSEQNNMQIFKPSRLIIPFPSRLINNNYEDKEVLGELIDKRESATNLKRLLKEKPRTGYQIEASVGVHDSTILEDSLPPKEKDPGSFTIPYHINNICFEKALVDLGVNVNVMPYSTFTNLGNVQIQILPITSGYTDPRICRSLDPSLDMVDPCDAAVSYFVF
ncbi:hypothetical protein Tco_1028091 [Tanacetum coccineum]